MVQLEAAKAAAALIAAGYLLVCGWMNVVTGPTVVITELTRNGTVYLVEGTALNEGEEVDFEAEIEKEPDEDPILSRLKVTYKKNGATIEYSTAWEPEPTEKEWALIKHIIKETTQENKWELIVRTLNKARRK